MNGEHVRFVAVPGGTFRMGSEEFYPEERPVVERTVAPMRIAESPVTRRQFARFVRETGYVTTAERPLDPADFDEPLLVSAAPGSLVFTPTAGPVDLTDWSQWWRWVEGANWRRPEGSDSSAELADDHPVVHVSYLDALAFCAWADCRLPTEAEWEHAARGGAESAIYAWGDEPQLPGDLRANTWQGAFPYRNDGANGWVGTSPVGSFPPNGYGLYDVTGNVWEWTSSTWSVGHRSASTCGCTPDAGERAEAERRVVKGGSHLCAPEYCLRYRPAARTRQTIDSSTSHMGFRVAAASNLLF